MVATHDFISVRSHPALDAPAVERVVAISARKDACRATFSAGSGDAA